MENKRFVLDSVKLVDSNACIIYEKPGNVISGAKGCKRIREAAEMRKDSVYYKLRSLAADDKFCYHLTHSCYRLYTMKSKIAIAQSKLLNTAHENVEKQLIVPSSVEVDNAVSNIQTL